MNITSVKSYNSITFKSTPSPNTSEPSEEVSSLGLDDESSRFIREQAIRSRISAGYEDTFHKYGGRMSEYELEKTRGTLLAKTDVVSDSAMKDIKARNLHHFGNNCYCGSTLVGKPNELAKLKKAGIQRVIDLQGYSDYARGCADAGLEYSTSCVGGRIVTQEACRDKESYLRGMKNDLEHRRQSKKEIARILEFYDKEFDRRKDEFIEHLIEFINTVNKGYVYVGCQCGTNQTDNALCLNSVFNPKFEDQGFHASNLPGDIMYDALKNLYNNLSDEHKKRLGFTKDFEQRLVERLEALKGKRG